MLMVKVVFCISFSPREKLITKIEVRPSFSVSQNGDRKEVLKLFKKYFKCGTIRPDRSDKTLKYEVRSLKYLISKVIPHFEKFPLLSSKQQDFEKFAWICRQMILEKHKDKQFLKKIIKIACQMNSGEFRKYKEEQLLSLI
jgi:hypothetical protein